jgi:hypothetical protein
VSTIDSNGVSAGISPEQKIKPTIAKPPAAIEIPCHDQITHASPV